MAHPGVRRRVVHHAVVHSRLRVLEEQEAPLAAQAVPSRRRAAPGERAELREVGRRRELRVV